MTLTRLHVISEHVRWAKVVVKCDSPTARRLAVGPAAADERAADFFWDGDTAPLAKKLLIHSLNRRLPRFRAPR